DHHIIRTSWLYSKKYGHNFYRTIVQRANEGIDLYITDDQRGCPTNTETLGKFILNKGLMKGLICTLRMIREDALPIPKHWGSSSLIK
ncbi:sugar nucleotide-binding protein, partial [Aquicoccus sp. SCR17]|nr:sugar nucleotide-binding protein [Carideicomes alvinocaridis]